MTVILLVGPKGVGKSWVADLLEAHLGIYHVDVDALVIELAAAGELPDPKTGWLRQVERATSDALKDHTAVSVEATGAWESDFILAANLESKGHRVVRVLVKATKAETMCRLSRRATRNKVPIAENEAQRIYSLSMDNTAVQSWDLILNLSGTPDPQEVVEKVAILVDKSP